MYKGKKKRRVPQKCNKRPPKNSNLINAPGV